MKYYFFDTSALFKRYQKEAGSEVVDQIFNLPRKKMVILSITLTEVISNLFRLRNLEEITDKELDILLSVFYKEISDHFEIHPLTELHIMKSEEINRKKRQTPIDTLQIAAALDFKEEDLVFVSSDPDLNKGIELEGIAFLNPEEVEKTKIPLS